MIKRRYHLDHHSTLIESKQIITMMTSTPHLQPQNRVQSSRIHSNKALCTCALVYAISQASEYAEPALVVEEAERVSELFASLEARTSLIEHQPHHEQQHDQLST